MFSSLLSDLVFYLFIFGSLFDHLGFSEWAAHRTITNMKQVIFLSPPFTVQQRGSKVIQRFGSFQIIQIIIYSYQTFRNIAPICHPHSISVTE